MPSESSESTGLAGRYATALYELAEADGTLDQVAEDLTRLRAMMDEVEDLRRLIRSPVLSRDDQGRAIAAVAERAGAADLTRRFLGVLARNRRLFALADVIKAYLGLVASGRGETTAEVVSAQPLTDEQVAAVGESLRRALGGGVAVQTRVDPGLLGGLVVRVGSRMIDSSLRTKLQQLRLAMKGIG